MLWSCKKRRRDLVNQSILGDKEPCTYNRPAGDEDEQSSRTHSATHFGGMACSLGHSQMKVCMYVGGCTPIGLTVNL